MLLGSSHGRWRLFEEGDEQVLTDRNLHSKMKPSPPVRRREDVCSKRDGHAVRKKSMGWALLPRRKSRATISSRLKRGGLNNAKRALVKEKSRGEEPYLLDSLELPLKSFTTG